MRMHYRLFGAAVLYLTAVAAAIGTEHIVELNKADIRRIMDESKRRMADNLPSTFTFTAKTDSLQDVPNRTSWTVKDVEDISRESPRLNITLTTDRLHLLSITVEFIDNTTISAPDFRIYASFIDDVQHNRYILQPSEVHPAMDQRKHIMPLRSPFRLEAIDNMKIVVLVFTRVVTTYRYDLDVDQLLDGTNESVASGLLYELVPPFSTMRIMFLIRHDVRSDLYTLWVTRRPPMPRCTVVATTGEEILFVEHVSSSTPWGVALNTKLPGLTRRQYTAPIRLIAHFYERRRSHEATFEIPNLKALLSGLQSERPSPIIPTSIDGMTLRPLPSFGGKHVGLELTAPSSIVNVLLQLRIDTTYVYCEELSHPPPGEPYEWSKVLTTNETQYEALTDKSTIRVQGTILFDWSKYDEDAEETLRHWIHTYGGDLRSVFFSRTSISGKRSNSSSVVRVRVPLNFGTVAASVPYTLLLSSSVAESSPAVQELMINNATAEAFEKACDELKVTYDSVRPLLWLSYYIMLGEPHPDTGMSWRPLYESIPLREPTSTPLFFTEEEIDLFNFEPGFRQRYEQTQRLYRAEYAAIAAHAPWLAGKSKEDTREFPQRWSENDYFALRSQVAARARNMTGVITIIPVMDSLSYSSQPSTSILFDNDHQQVLLITQRAVSAGEELSVDYGTYDRSRIDFFFQFGILSRQSPDETVLQYTTKNKTVLNVTLTSRRASIEPLLAELRRDSDEPAQARFSAIKLLNDAKRKMGDAAPTFGSEGEQSLNRNIIEECANALFAARKEILGLHIRWLSDL